MRPKECDAPPCDWHTTLLHYATMLRMRPLNQPKFKSGNLTYDLIAFPDKTTNQTFGKDKVLGDYTAKYTYMFRTQTIEKIYHFTPHAKLLYSLRDPTDRARSHLNYCIKGRLPFVERFFTMYNSTDKGVMKQIHYLYVQTIEKYRKCMTVFCEEFCATNTSGGPDFFSFTMESLIEKTLLNGLYHVFLKRQLEVAPVENVLIIDLGEFSKSPLNFTEETILPFLGLDNYEPDTKQYFENTTPANVNIMPLVSYLPETTALLKHFYKESLIKLSALLNGRRFTWYPNYGV